MILWLRCLLIFSLFASTSSGNEQLFGGDGSGSGIASTMIGNRLTDDSLSLVYNLGSFVSPPAYPKVYFSSDDAASGLPVGNDSTGDGSRSAPFRTIEKAVEITNQGHVEIVWDCEDTWDSAGDYGTIPVEGFIVNMPCTGLEDELCAIWSSTDPTGQCLWTHDYAALDLNPTTRLYGWGGLSEDTWWGVQNGRVINFPPNPTRNGDIFRSDGAAKQHVVVMNFDAPNIQGQNNQLRTSHSLTELGAQFVAINVNCTVMDRAGNVASVGPAAINVVKSGTGSCPAGDGDCLQGVDWVAQGFQDGQGQNTMSLALTGFTEAANNQAVSSTTIDSTNMVLTDTDLVAETGDGNQVVEEEYHSQCIHDTGDSNLLIIGGTWTMDNSPVTYGHGQNYGLILTGLIGAESVIVGADIRDSNPQSTAPLGRVGVVFPMNDGVDAIGVIANTTIRGFAAPSSGDNVAHAIRASISSSSTADLDLRLYKTSFKDSQAWVAGRYGAVGSNVLHFGRCVSGNTTQGLIMNGVGSESCANADYDYQAIYFDDTANPSFRGGSMGTKDTAAAFVADSVAAGCNGGSGFTEWGTDADSVNSSTSPFLSGTSVCDASTGCFQGCPYDFVYDFRTLDLPASVFGRKVTGLHLGTSDQKNIGN